MEMIMNIPSILYRIASALNVHEDIEIKNLTPAEACSRSCQRPPCLLLIPTHGSQVWNHSCLMHL